MLFVSARFRSVDLGLCFSNEFVLPQRGTPGQIFQNFVFWVPLSNERSHRCSEVFVSEIFAFKVFDFISEHLEISQHILDNVRNFIYLCVHLEAIKSNGIIYAWA